MSLATDCRNDVSNMSGTFKETIVQKKLKKKLKHATSMCTKSEPAIWSPHSDQWLPCFDSCQLSMTWMTNIKDVPIVMLPLSHFSYFDLRIQLRDNQRF